MDCCNAVVQSGLAQLAAEQTQHEKVISHQEMTAEQHSRMLTVCPNYREQLSHSIPAHLIAKEIKNEKQRRAEASYHKLARLAGQLSWPTQNNSTPAH
jgi:hypothetical protein